MHSNIVRVRVSDKQWDTMSGLVAETSEIMHTVNPNKTLDGRIEVVREDRLYPLRKLN